MGSLVLLSQINKTSAALSWTRVFSYKNVLSFFGTGDSEKAAGEEIKNQLPLTPGPCPEGQNWQIRQGLSQSPVIAGIHRDSHSLCRCICLMSPIIHCLTWLSFLRLSHSSPLRLARLDSTQCTKISNMSRILSNDSMCHINSFSDIDSL